MNDSLERVFGARDAGRDGAWVVIEGRCPAEVLWCAERGDVLERLRDYMRRHGLPSHQWEGWFTVVEMDMAEAARISETVRTGAKA